MCVLGELGENKQKLKRPFSSESPGIFPRGTSYGVKLTSNMAAAEESAVVCIKIKGVIDPFAMEVRTHLVFGSVLEGLVISSTMGEERNKRFKRSLTPKGKY